MLELKKINHPAGFSLIEIMFVLAIMLLLLDAAWTLYQSATGNSDIFNSNLDAQTEIRKSFSSMTAWIRSAAPASTGSYAIADASSTEFTCFSDIDSDGGRERVHYFLSGRTLEQGITEPTGSPPTYNGANEKISAIVHNIANTASTSIFSYYDKNYNGSSTPLAVPVNIPDIRLIKITILIDKDPLRPPAALTFTTQVSIRSLKDNL